MSIATESKGGPQVRRDSDAGGDLVDADDIVRGRKVIRIGLGQNAGVS